MSNEQVERQRDRPSGDEGVRDGLDRYADVLAGSGGRQLEALLSGGDGRGVGAALYTAPPYDLTVPALPVSRLSLNQTRARTDGAVHGERLREFDARRYSLFLSPAGAAMRWHKHAPSCHLNIYFRGDAFADADGPAPSIDGSVPLFNLMVPGIRGLADELINELQRPTMLNTDAADSLARLLLVRVARHLKRSPATASALSPAMLARLRDHVMAHLSERVLVADLARVAGLSPDHFAAAFKHETGQTPHQSILALRLAHATELLTRTRRSLADIAHDCGFANQQHLTNAMQRHLGTTPGRCRNAHAPRDTSHYG